MPHLNEDKVRELEKTANQIRQDIIEELMAAGSGPTAGPLDISPQICYV